MMRLLALFLAIGIPAVVAAPAAAATTVSVGLVGRSSNDWPLYIAQSTGIFAANGLSVDIINADSPVGATQQLLAGALDFGAVTSTQTAQAVQSGATIVSLLQNTNKPPYFVIGKKGVTSIAALRGKTVIVSGPSAITRVFMDTVLTKNGVNPSDVTYTYAGATNDRYAALLSGAVDASVLLPPFSFNAIAAGYPLLDSVQKYYPHFPFDTYAATTSWAPAHRAIVVAFLKSCLAGTRFLYDPANKARSIQILETATGTPHEDAIKTYDLLITQMHSYTLNGTSTPDDYRQVLEALVQLGLAKPPLPPPTKFYDNSYALEALDQLNKAKK